MVAFSNWFLLFIIDNIKEPFSGTAFYEKMTSARRAVLEFFWNIKQEEKFPESYQFRSTICKTMWKQTKFTE
jgi:hypothetical protein